jgi:hypothetical protein
MAGPARLQVFKAPDGSCRVRYADTGCYDVSSDGREIIWYPEPGASEELVRCDVMGNVLALAQHLAGAACLHGSAVAIGDAAVGFLAPKGYGKSTLALALTAAGGRLLTDDTLPVDLGTPPMARPGVHAVRLVRDAAERLGAARQAVGHTDGKHILSDLPAERRMTSAAPLAALYVLMPVAGAPDAPSARRTRMPDVQAALAVVAHAKIGHLLGGSESPVVFERGVEIARRVPVYALQVARDLDRLGDVVDTVLAWHGARPALAAVAGA